MTNANASPVSEILVTAAPGERTGTLEVADHRFDCALGRSGIVGQKREGDGGTPAGLFPLRTLYHRQDRLSAPATPLPSHSIAPDDGWCDAPDDPAYNRPVRLPYPASAETMWRTDHLYDIVIVLGYNDAPVVPGAGSAIFFHLANEKEGRLQPTEGCVALRLDDMRRVLALCGAGTAMRIEPR